MNISKKSPTFLVLEVSVKCLLKTYVFLTEYPIHTLISGESAGLVRYF